MAFVLAGLCALAAPPVRAAEEETHFFNPTLSLTGDCSTSSLDPVADPGCPGGSHPALGAFDQPRAVATDLHGDRYVSSYGKGSKSGAEGRVDVFGPTGKFITELADSEGPETVAVDSEGNLYVAQKSQLVRFAPTVYKPQAEEIAYTGPATFVSESPGLFKPGIVVDPASDHVFFCCSYNLLKNVSEITEYGSAVEGNQVISKFGELTAPHWLGLDAAHKRIYASFSKGKTEVAVFNLDAPHQLLGVIDGSSTPTHEFVTSSSGLALAVDEASGHVFAGEFGNAAPKVYELDDGGDYVSTIRRSGQLPTQGSMSYDNSPSSPTHGDLFVPSGEGAPAHSLVFESKPPAKAPTITFPSVSGVSEREAVLRATVNPQAQPATYYFEYTTEQSFEEEGFAAAVLAKKGTLPAANEGLAVSVPATGLEPDTPYRFRVRAENKTGQVEEQSAFKTYRPLDLSKGCANEARRAGPSANLPDCRAYELVTPSSTNGRPPISLVAHLGIYFPTRSSSPDGKRVSFLLEGGAIPGYEGTGSLAGDPYLATRTDGGWSTSAAGPNGYEAPQALPGSASADQGFSFWQAEGGGSASVKGEHSDYVRYPDGHSELLGQGSLDTDPQAVGLMISENGGHIVFQTKDIPGHAVVQLQPEAPPPGTAAIYDRTPGGVTHVVSLLPGDATPGAGENATYLGASLDGRGIAFSIGDVLYLRVDDEETYEIGALPEVVQQTFEKITFEGIAEGGQRLFYLEGGNLYAFDAETEARIPFVESGDATVVHVSADGSTVYFVSPSVLDGEGNPNGELAEAGAENLYRSREGQMHFVARVTKLDVTGEFTSTEFTPALGRWKEAAEGRFGADSSRTTPDGGVLVFESRAKLTAYDPEGHAEVYRYDSGGATGAGALTCVSCNPTQARASGEASLQSNSQSAGAPPPLTASMLAGNLRSDGRRVVFQSEEALVPADTDGVQDVYEWEEEDVGSCHTDGGCVYLITSGRSVHPNYLYGVSANGDDVFFTTADLLDPARDPDETRSIYDARVNGGFPPPRSPAGECLGEACQPSAVAPNDATPASSSFEGPGNVKEAKAGRCPQGKRVVHARGKTRCVARHKKHHKRARANRRTHR
jgi:hypothetical protein